MHHGTTFSFCARCGLWGLCHETNSGARLTLQSGLRQCGAVGESVDAGAVVKADVPAGVVHVRLRAPRSAEFPDGCIVAAQGP